MLDPKIETFLTICKCMNFTKAAEELHLTQPAVSSQMKRLEEYYGCPLFVYENKLLTLTQVGKAVYDSVNRMENQEIYLRNQIQFIQTRKRNIRFGATMTIGEFLLADLIADYIKTYPDSSIKMEVTNTQNLLHKLDNAELDFAFIEGNFSKEKYKSYPFKKSRFIPVCGSDYNRKNQTVSLNDLMKECLIIRERGSGTRDIFESILHSKNHETEEFSSVVEVGNMNAIKDLLLRSVGISFLYEDVVKKELEQKCLFEIQLSGWDISHRMSVVWRQENEHTEVMEEFLGMLEL